MAKRTSVVTSSPSVKPADETSVAGLDFLQDLQPKPSGTQSTGPQMQIADNAPQIFTAVQQYLKARDYAKYSQVIDRWIWVRFADEHGVQLRIPNGAYREMLDKAGFKWSRKRGAFYHECGCKIIDTRFADFAKTRNAVALDDYQPTE